MKDKEKKILASDCKCCECGKKAIAFYPFIDPDIPSNPYCEECLTKVKLEVLTELYKIEQKWKKSTLRKS